MLRWLGIALLAASWLLSLGYYHDPGWPASVTDTVIGWQIAHIPMWVFSVVIGIVLLAGAGRRAPHRRYALMAVVLLVLIGLPAVMRCLFGPATFADLIAGLMPYLPYLIGPVAVHLPALARSSVSRSMADRRSLSCQRVLAASGSVSIGSKKKKNFPGRTTGLINTAIPFSRS